MSAAQDPADSRLSITAAIKKATSNHGPVVKWSRTSYRYIFREKDGAPWHESIGNNTRLQALRNRRASIAEDAARLMGLADYDLAWAHVLNERATIREAIAYVSRRHAGVME